MFARTCLGHNRSQDSFIGGDHMPHALNLTIRLGTWEELRHEASPIRMEVFVQEQKVPLEEEVDAMDAVSDHAVAFDSTGAAIGTGRLLPDGHIGRMSVRKLARGLGVGSAILRALVERARKRNLHAVALHAQTHARDFYVQHGFVAEGDAFDEANIPHILMRRNLSA